MSTRNRGTQTIEVAVALRPMTRHRIQRVFFAVLIPSVLCMVALGGCNILGPAFYIIHGPEKTPAQYDLDKSRVTVVFIDDRMNRAPRRSLRIAAADAVEQELMQRGELPEENVITTRAMMRLAAQEEFTAPMTIAEMGRTVGAEVVIYATIDTWTLSPDGVSFTPGARVRVKVIDATNDVRLWPGDASGFPVVASLPPQTAPLASSAQQDRTNLALANALGIKIARLFFKHEKDSLSGELDD